MSEQFTYPESKICKDKICVAAGELQSSDHFYKNDTTPDGLAYYCKACMKRRAADYRAAHPEKAKEWHQNTIKRYRERNAARRAAAADASRLVDTE
jgi:hypothetical protein